MGSIRGWTAGLVLVLAGCSPGGGGGTDSSMREDVDALREHVEDVRAETGAHASAIGEMADVDSVMDEEMRHHGALEEHAGSMDAVMAQMDACLDDMGEPPDTAPMSDAVQEFLMECTSHMAVMGSAGNMGDATAEEARHQGAMDMMLDSMDMMMDSANDAAGNYDCSGGMMEDS